MAGSPDKLSARPNHDGFDRERFSADEMEDYGDWLKSDTGSSVDYSRLSNEEENLLGSFSPTTPGAEEKQAEEISWPVSVRFSDNLDEADPGDQKDSGEKAKDASATTENVESDSRDEDEMESEETLDSSLSVFADQKENRDGPGILEDEFVLGLKLRGDRAVFAEPTSASSILPDRSREELESGYAEDDISDEFFEIDDEVSSQEVATAANRLAGYSASDPVRIDREIIADIPKADFRQNLPDGSLSISERDHEDRISTSGERPENRETTKPERTKPSSAKAVDQYHVPAIPGLNNDILTRIAHELSSIRVELVGIKERFASNHESPDAASNDVPVQFPESIKDSTLPADAYLSAIATSASEAAETMVPFYRAAEALPHVPDLPVSEADASTLSPITIMATPDSRFSSEFINELRGMFSYMDKLLESLPDSKIEEFARSPYFDSYKHIFEALGIA